jgi:hypothetical protein
MPSNLVLAYLATDYLAFDKGRAVPVRVGQRSLLVDALLAKMNARSGALITAWNPFGKSQSAGVNACRDRELKGYLNAHGFAFLPGEGRGRIGEWPPELSLLAFDMSRPQAASIGRRFRQNAIGRRRAARMQRTPAAKASRFRNLSVAEASCPMKSSREISSTTT